MNKPEHSKGCEPRTLCGGCLHAVECHEQHNGHFMYCGACFKLCDNIDFNNKHKPTSLEKNFELMAKREIGIYVPKELKKNE